VWKDRGEPAAGRPDERIGVAMRWKSFSLGAAAGALAVASAFLVAMRSDAASRPEPPAAPALDPLDRPIDAARVGSGRLAIERMPAEVTSALELHSEEIVKTATIVAGKQARVIGRCAPGSAIRVVQEDGSVVCQRMPRGVVSVSALSGLPRRAATRTAQGAVAGGVGRYQLEGEEDLLVIPVHLPDGAVVTSFSGTYWVKGRVEGEAFLYRSDGVQMANVHAPDGGDAVRTASTETIAAPRIDNSQYAYVVYMRISARAAADLMPVSASVAYRLP
jgi:hypothetical protein